MTCAADLHRAAGMAYRVLAARKIRSLPIDPLPILRACRNTVVMTVEEAADACGVHVAALEREFAEADALTLRRQTEETMEYIIVYRPGGNPARLRFTLAHELGHRILGHDSGSAAEEREADCFASHLLCPEPVIRRLRRRFGRLSAEHVAAACYVSLSCARMAGMRKAELGGNMYFRQVDELLAEAVEKEKVVIRQRGIHELPPKGE